MAAKQGSKKTQQGARKRRPAPARAQLDEFRLQTALEAINEGVYDWDVAKNRIHYTDRVYSVLDMPRSITTPAAWRKRVHREDLAAYDAAIVAHFTKKSPRFECDYRYRDANGRWRWARQHGIAIRDGRGRAIRMIGSTGDITEFKRVEQALKDSEERYVLATLAGTEGIYDWNLTRNTLFLSERAKQFFGIKSGKLTPAAWNERVHPDDFAGYRMALIRCFKGEERRLDVEYRIRKPQGGWRWILDHGAPLRDAGGRATRLVGAVSDIDRRKQAELELTVARDEAREALERQTATAEILKVIASSPADVQPVFEAIVRSVSRLFGTRFSVLQLLRDGRVEMPAVDGEPGFERLRERYPRPLDESTAGSLAMLRKQSLRIDSLLTDPNAPPATVQFARDFGFQSVIFTPMVHEGRVIGAIGGAHPDPHGFGESHVALLRTFADQAVIAIENVRLFNETREALERQTATAEILKVISSSPTDVQPVFDAIASSAKRLLDGGAALVSRRVGDLLQLAAFTSTSAEGDAALQRYSPMRIEGKGHLGKAVLTGAPVLVSDIETDSNYSDAFRADARKRGLRSVVSVPMLRDGEVIGVISVNRPVAGKFSDHQTNLLRTFADQAVIAIENVRLFNETRMALERQTATAEILRVISDSPSDVQPVFRAVCEQAAHICEAQVVDIIVADGAFMHVAATYGELGRPTGQPTPLDRTTVMGRSIVDRQTVHVADLQAEGHEFPRGRELALKYGHRTIVGVPLVREGKALGTILVRRPEVRPFDAQHLSILRTFADQAAIAIENVRLFNETREALQRQTATADILRVIAGSPADVNPVFNAIGESAARLCDAVYSAVLPLENGMLHLGATYNWDGEGFAVAQRLFPMPVTADHLSAIAVREHRIISLDKLQTDPSIPATSRELAAATGYDSIAIVPMVREGSAQGALVVARRSPFSADQVTLLQTFADQAVIAIENVRLFNELKQRVEQMTALREVGQAISSTLELDDVLQTVVTRAVQLTSLDGGAIYEYDARDEVYNLKAAEKFPEEFVETVRRTPIRKGDGATGRTAVTLEPVQVPDIQSDAYMGSRREILEKAGYRAILAVPLLREDTLVGALMVMRKSSGQFPAEVVELLRTFAAQSALAIQNARLFREIADKGRQLEEASRHKSNFLASMSHELRTPLNAILGFNEMILDEIYGEVSADVRAPLENIQASGKHLLRLINNVLDLAKIESGRMELALSDYAVQDTVASVCSTLQPLAAGKGLEFIARVPDDLPLAYGDGGRIAQCLINLGGNSLKFTKAGRVEIAVAQRDELLRFSISDTGMGIPPDKISSLFTEFKQTDATIATEYGGTGLGLSITRKFVEMHGGRIWVESEPGKGSTFTFEVPLRVAP